MFVFICDWYGKIEFDWFDWWFLVYVDFGIGFKVVVVNIVYCFVIIDKYCVLLFFGYVVLVF